MKNAKQIAAISKKAVATGEIAPVLVQAIEAAAAQGRFYASVTGLSAADEHRLAALGFVITRGSLGKVDLISWEVV